jgi:hypothetical protein
MVIRTRSIGQARPGDLATYRLGSLQAFENGRSFAPSAGLLAAYKTGRLSWEAYERQYLAEMASLYQRSPDLFLALLRRPEVTLVYRHHRPMPSPIAGGHVGPHRGRHGVQAVRDIQ